MVIFVFSSLALSQEDSKKLNERFIYRQPIIPSQFSSVMEEYLFFDNNFNVARRLRDEKKAKDNLLSEEDKKPVRVFLFEASIDKLNSNLVISNYIENTDWKRVQNNESSILIPCLESDTLSYNTLKFKFGEPVYTTMGRKVLSRSTYYIDPIGSVGGFFAKFVPHIPGVEQKIEREILVNDYIKAQLEYLPKEMRNLTMDSFMGVNLSLLGIPISVAYRSADRILNQTNLNEKVFPGHGFLGCDQCIEKIATKMFPDLPLEKAIDHWKTQEFLPKFAKNIAVSNHLLGLSFEAHTQNWTVKVDMNSGKIMEFYFRDFADVLLNPTSLLSQNRLPKDIPWNRVKLLSLHRQYFSDLGASIAKDIWFHSSLYVGQSVTSHVNGFQRQEHHLHIFLKEYLKETEAIIGQKIVLSKDAQKVMAQLENKVSKEMFYSGELLGRSLLRNAMASVLKPVFEQINEVALNDANKKLSGIPLHLEQSELAKQFFKSLNIQRVVFTSEKAQTQIGNDDTKLNWYKKTASAYIGFSLFSKSSTNASLEFKIWNGRIWAIDKETKAPLAVIIDPLPNEDVIQKNVPERRSFLNLFRRSNLNINQCRSIFK